MILLDLSRHTVRRNRSLYLGAFVALFLGVTLIGLTVELVAAVNLAGSTPAPAAAATRAQLDDASSLFGVMSGFSGFLAIFVIASTFAFGVASRRRDLALVRLLGATPRQVRRMILGESAIVAAAASLAGGVLAHLLAPTALRLAADRGITPGRLAAPSPWPTLGIAVPIGIAVGLLGARAAARRAGQVPALDALRESAVDPRRIGRWRAAIGTVLLATPPALFLSGNSLSGEAALVVAVLAPEMIVVGLVCFGPLLVPALVRLLGRLAAGRGGVSIRLARDTLSARGGYAASLAAPTLAISAIAGSLLVTLAVAADVDRAVNQARLAAPLVVVGGGAATSAALSRSPMVQVADASIPVTLTVIDEDGYRDVEEAEAVDVATAVAARRLTARQGSLALLRGRAIAASGVFVSDSGLRVGQWVTVSVDGAEPIHLRLVAVVDEAPALHADLLVPNDLLSSAPGGAAGLASRWFVIPKPDLPDPLAALTDELRGTGAEVQTASTWIAATDTELRRSNTVVLWVLLGPAGIYAALAIANTLLMSSLHRRREFATIRLVGATPGQVRRMVWWEAGLVTVVALLLGGLTTAGVAAGVRRTLDDGAGNLSGTVAITVPWRGLVLIAVTCVTVAVLAALAPTCFGPSRVHPSEALDG